MLQADSAANRLTGIALISLCYVLFTLLDGAAKWLVASVPVVVVVWLRFLIHAAVRFRAVVSAAGPGAGENHAIGAGTPRAP